MGRPKSRTTNIFTTIDQTTYVELARIALLSTQQRRSVYRMALMYAVTKPEFWGLFLLSGDHAVSEYRKITALLLGMAKRIKKWHEKENAPSK